MVGHAECRRGGIAQRFVYAAEIIAGDPGRGGRTMVRKPFDVRVAQTREAALRRRARV